MARSTGLGLVSAVMLPQWASALRVPECQWRHVPGMAHLALHRVPECPLRHGPGMGHLALHRVPDCR